MPVYEIRTKDGTPVEVEGPSNATWEQLASIYSKQQEYRKIFGSPEITDPGLGAVSYTHLTLPTNREV